ncbi:unnamed protein product [Cyprideis torosa]|uniref:Uncharacterized protein n=1 Tax=Cyprideis torosa TaxID=163714 RepID=A0A7R8ZKC3_9CRUS|nr:unnamed protein product [Cyprideis torosa]CAG0889038.1 unnamed protein product [Cyprideis torosa]
MKIMSSNVNRLLRYTLIPHSSSSYVGCQRCNLRQQSIRIPQFLPTVYGSRSLFTSPPSYHQKIGVIEENPLLQDVTGLCVSQMSEVNANIVDNVRRIFDFIESHDHDPSCMDRLTPASQAELPPRTMRDSYTVAQVPLSTDRGLRETHLNAFGGVRLGRILEVLDRFAVMVSYRHCVIPQQDSNDPPPMTIVTGMVDQISFGSEVLDGNLDLRFRGHVTNVSNSTMEVTIYIEQPSFARSDEWQVLTAANFVMVARSPTRKCAFPVNPLVLETEEERQISAFAVKRKENRKFEERFSLLRTPPSPEERLLIHNLFLETIDEAATSFHQRRQPENSVWMETQKLKNIVLCHPEYSNMYGKVFGGFLMRSIYELSFSLCWMFTGERPQLKEIDDVAFKRPVELGSLLLILAEVVYTEGNTVQIRSTAEVVNPSKGEEKLTNVFYMTFYVPTPVSRVIPLGYHEYMKYLDGRRRLIKMQRQDIFDSTPA